MTPAIVAIPCARIDVAMIAVGFREPAATRTPITGVAHVAYRPDGRVVGISKLSRLVDAFARRLQLQERLTNQIAAALDRCLRPRGVAVIVEASHACMSTRGVKQHGIAMVTRCWLGEFESDPELRREMMDSIRSEAGRPC